MRIEEIKNNPTTKFVGELTGIVKSVFRKEGNTRGRNWYLTRVLIGEQNSNEMIDVVIFDSNEKDYQEHNYKQGEILLFKNLVVERNDKGISLKKINKTVITKALGSPSVVPDTTISNRPDLISNNTQVIPNNTNQYLKDIAEELKNINQNLVKLMLVLAKNE